MTQQLWSPASLMRSAIITTTVLLAALTKAHATGQNPRPDYVLTKSRDVIRASRTNDYIEGPSGTLQTVDCIDGGRGNDTLRAGAAQDGVQSPKIVNVETVIVDTGGLAFDPSRIAGARRLIADGASLIVRPINADHLALRFGAKAVKSGTVKLQFADDVLDAGHDTLALLSRNSNVTFTSDSTYDATDDGEENATEDRRRIKAIDLRVEGVSNQVDLSDFDRLDHLSISGPARTKVVLGAPTLARIDARGTTGGIHATSDIARAQTVLGGAGDDYLKTGAGNDYVASGDGNDVVVAGGGNNSVRAGGGADRVFTEQGVDDIEAGRGDDRVSAGSGRDRLAGGPGADRLVAGDGADDVNGGAGDDVLVGQGGADTLRDGPGADVVHGGSGADHLIAGPGDDLLVGGGGVDRFDFRGADFGSDTVADFALTTDAKSNDVVVFAFDGRVRRLSSKQDFESAARHHTGRIDADADTDTITIRADGGEITLKVTDADFLTKAVGGTR